MKKRLIFKSRTALKTNKQKRTYRRQFSNNTTCLNVICIKKETNKQKNDQFRLQPCPATAVLGRRNGRGRQTPPPRGPEMAAGRGRFLRPRARLASLSASPAYRARGCQEAPTYLQRVPHPGGRTSAPWRGAVAGSCAHRLHGRTSAPSGLLEGSGPAPG